jgi:hypothetical protein
MKPSQVKAALKTFILAHIPAWVWGPPGVGKSSITRQLADELGVEFWDLRASTIDPVDLRGCPSVEEGITRWNPPEFLPRKGKGVLMLDELGQVDQSVQKALLQLVLDRRLGNYVMPEGWHIIAASNRAEDRAGVGRTITPLLNRFAHIDFELDGEEWFEWAALNGILPVVRAFLRFRPGLLLDFKPEIAQTQRAFPTPRAWEKVSRALEVGFPPEIMVEAVAGLVGPGAGAEFGAFHEEWTRLERVEDILANPEQWAVPDKPSLLYAYAMAFADRANTPEMDRINCVWRAIVRLPAEYAVLAAKDVLRLNKKAILAPAAKAFIGRYGDLLKEDKR